MSFTLPSKACEAAKRDVLQVLVQVNTSLEESKGGCKDDEVADVAQHIVGECLKPKHDHLARGHSSGSTPLTERSVNVHCRIETGAWSCLLDVGGRQVQTSAVFGKLIVWTRKSAVEK